MDPVAIQIGSLAIRWYGIMAAVGFLLGSWVVFRLKKISGLDEDRCSGVLLTAMVAGIAGARIFYVVQFWHYYRNDFLSVFRVDQGGLVFYGGFILSIISIGIYCRIHKLDFIRLLDVFTPAIAIAHCCGRIGCFLNGCCYGKPATGWFSVNYPAGSDAAIRYPGSGVLPVQLIEAGENIIAFFIFYQIAKRTRRGVAVSSYFISYGVLRFINEFWRGDNPKIFGLLTPAQLIGVILIPTGAAMLFYFLKYDRKNA